MMRRITAFVLLAAVAGILLAGCGKSPQKMLDKIQPGMTYQQVVQIVGSEGTKFTPPQVPAPTPPQGLKGAPAHLSNTPPPLVQVVEVYDWKDAGIQCVFKDGKLLSKGPLVQVPTK
ncbi:MAG: hypothetical protein ACYDBB_23820 [Armatimonadota bacterium]